MKEDKLLYLVLSGVNKVKLAGLALTLSMILVFSQGYQTQAAESMSEPVTMNKPVTMNGPEAGPESATMSEPESAYESYLEGLQDMLEDHPADKSGTGRLILHSGDVPFMEAWGEVGRLAKGEDYTILQFESQAKANEALKLLKGQGFEVMKDRIIKMETAMLPDRGSHVNENPEAMNLDDLDCLLSRLDFAGKSHDCLNQETGDRVVVGFLDTGVRAEYFPGRVVEGIVTIGKGDSVYAEDHDSLEATDDKLGHGTGVAGTILDMTSDRVSVMPIKVMDDGGNSSVTAIDLGLMYGAQYCDVLNMSIGYGSSNALYYDFWQASIDYAIAEGIPVVAASGNDGVSTDEMYPACYEPCWTVGAIDQHYNRAYFSNYGEVDFVAVGQDVHIMGLEGKLKTNSGTSFSAPVISGLAAEIMACRPDLSMEEIYQLLVRSCLDLGDRGRDANYGWGMPVFAHGEEFQGFTWREDCESAYGTFACPNHPAEEYDLEAEIRDTVILQPTCKERGLVTRTASIPCPGIQMGVEDGDEGLAGDVENRYGTGICQRVYEDSLQLYLPFGDHLYKTVTTKAKWSTDGSIVTSCKNCGLVQSKKIIARPGTLSLSGTRFVYTGKRLRPGLVLKDRTGKTIPKSAYQVTWSGPGIKVGIYQVTLKLQGQYTGTRTRTYRIVPKATSLVSLSKITKGIGVSWKKRSAVTGYQVQYSTKKNWSSDLHCRLIKDRTVKSCKLKGLKRGRYYYVRIRTYKLTDGRKIFSNWSVRKRIKV